MNTIELRWTKIRPQHPMPRYGEQVLVFRDGCIGEATFDKLENEPPFFVWIWDRDGYPISPPPTHWMPLPPPPKEFGR